MFPKFRLPLKGAAKNVFSFNPSKLYTAITSAQCLRPYLKTIASKPVCKSCCRTSRQASQSLFAAYLDLLVGQPNTNQTRNKQLPQTSFEGSWSMGTSLRKIFLGINPLRSLLEPGLRKNHTHGTGGMWGTWHCLGNNLPEHLIKGCATKRQGDPTTTNAHRN